MRRDDGVVVLLHIHVKHHRDKGNGMEKEEQKQKKQQKRKTEQKQKKLPAEGDLGPKHRESKGLWHNGLDLKPAKDKAELTVGIDGLQVKMVCSDQDRGWTVCEWKSKGFLLVAGHTYTVSVNGKVPTLEYQRPLKLIGSWFVSACVSRLVTRACP